MCLKVGWTAIYNSSITSFIQFCFVSFRFFHFNMYMRYYDITLNFQWNICSVVRVVFIKTIFFVSVNHLFIFTLRDISFILNVIIHLFQFINPFVCFLAFVNIICNITWSIYSLILSPKCLFYVWINWKNYTIYKYVSSLRPDIDIITFSQPMAL